MSPIYYYADIQSWVSNMICEHIEGLDSDDKKEFIKEIDGGMNLKDWCWEMMLGTNVISSEELLNAVLNSCEWDELYYKVKEFEEEESEKSEEEEDEEESDEIE